MADKENKDLKSKKGLENFFSDLGDEETIKGEYGKLDQIVDEVMMLLENSGPVTGGIITFERIHEFLLKGSHPGIEIDTVAEVIDKLRENNVISGEIEVAGRSIYLFQPVQIDLEMQQMMKPFLANPMRTRIDLMTALKWDGAKVEQVIIRFKQQKMMKEINNGLTIPGF
jgi:hypothetical protein